MTATLWEYDTAVWYQRLESTPDGARLYREFRGDGPWPRVTGEAFATAGTLGSAWVPPGPGHGGRYSFDLSATEHLAGLLWPRIVPRLNTVDALDLPREVGRLLARLHEKAPSNTMPPAGPNIARLRRYLRSVNAQGSGVLGTLRHETVVRLAEILADLEAAPEQVLCHGGFSLGSIFTDDGCRSSQIVIGPEMCVAAPELDLGWMLGELTEFEFAASSSGATPPVYTAFANAFREGYQQEVGRTIDETLLAGVIAVRVALHRFDFAATTGGHEDPTVTVFVDWLVDRWGRNHREAEC